MAKFKIVGGKPLVGEVKAAGNKNSALPLMAASLLVDGPVSLSNVPKIRDVAIMAQIIEGLGGKVEGVGTDKVTIDATKLSSFEPDAGLMRKFRGSVLLIAPLLSRFGKARIVGPGGDSIGERLLDTHFELLVDMGVNIREVDGMYEMDAKNLVHKEVFLNKVSVTATEIGFMIAASLNGKTVIEDAASEPHVQDLAGFLVKAGANIDGAGTNTVVIEGNNNLKSLEYSVRPDHIEVGTFAIAAAVTGGSVKISGAVGGDLKMILSYFSDMNVSYNLQDGRLEVLPSELTAKRKEFQTRPWPGFPTDLMSTFIVLATQTKGTILCHDWMYEWRIFFVDHLIKMGADITIADPHRIIVNGPRSIRGDTLPTNDIRAGSALVLAALAARGESIVDDIEIIERGYEDLEQRLSGLGAEISRIE